MGERLKRAALTGLLGCGLIVAGWSGVVAEEDASPARDASGAEDASRTKPASPAEEASQAGLSVELNSLQQVDAACRVVFMVENRLGGDLKGVSFETVLINRAGVVDRLTVFDFKALPKGRVRVRQFKLPDTQCGAIGRVLINGAATCQGDGIVEGACINELSVSSKTDVEISG